jgi:hypothetical protein
MNILFENFNHLIVRDFWMVNFDHVFISPYELQFLFVFQFLCLKIICFESFTCVIIHMNFMGFSFGTSKVKNDINYIKYKFSHRFGKVCMWLNMYYSNIRIISFKKIATMSIWIILKKLIWTYKECNFYQYWTLWLCIHPLVIYWYNLGLFIY